ncbi:hypothetical protein B0H16DRAFT_1452295 [Mycena metata]|uniref:Uncharacterized protein n=1 Tax=Mycena metata TaxID=1033252 RepID=A0AAD7JT21_9AGAR|nr:hypothetical protein B0H16DRAFT_1452295 [Mycena metata]
MPSTSAPFLPSCSPETQNSLKICLGVGSGGYQGLVKPKALSQGHLQGLGKNFPRIQRFQGLRSGKMPCGLTRRSARCGSASAASVLQHRCCSWVTPEAQNYFESPLTFGREVLGFEATRRGAAKYPAPRARRDAAKCTAVLHHFQHLGAVLAPRTAANPQSHIE